MNITLSNSVGNTSFNASVTVDTLLPTDIPTATVYLTAVPDIVTGDITISNTEAAAPQQTGDAVGADRGDTFPLPLCQVLAPFGSYCDPTSTDCWYKLFCFVILLVREASLPLKCIHSATGTTCISNLCQRLCDISTVEAYCDDEFPCDATLGYVCTSSRCRPPATATHVAVGATCDQGTANTLFWFVTSWPV